MWRSTFALALLSMALARPAAADMVESPPERCPPGAAGAMSHAGPHCRPTECETPRDCAQEFWGARGSTNFACERRGLCIGRSVLRAGRGQPAELAYAVRACAQDADCPEGIRCELRDRCLRPADREPFEGDAQLPYAVVIALLLFFAAGAAWSLLRPGAELVLAESQAGQRASATARVALEDEPEHEADAEREPARDRRRRVR